MKNAKRIGALICVFAICFTLVCAPSSHAAGTPLLGGQQFGAWMLAGLVSINTVMSALQATTMEPLRQWQAAPWSETNPYFAYPYDPPSISDYINASIIKIDQGVTTIDGVEYDELWMSPEGAQKVKANVFDFKTKWGILSGEAGTLARGAGYYFDNPVYRIGNKYQTQTYISEGPPSYYAGQIQVYNVQNQTYPDYFTVYYKYPDGQIEQPGTMRTSQTVKSWWSSSDKVSWRGYYNVDRNVSHSSPASGWVEEEFQFDYVAGIVPVDESEIPENYGLSLKIPHDKLQTFYNTYPQYNIDNSVINIQQDEIDIDQLTQAIFDMIDSMEDIKAEWTSGEEPEPPVPVDPIENIDQNVQDITGYQQDMQQQVDHMHQDVEAIHQTQQQQQQVQQQMQQDTSSIESTLKDVTATPGQSDLPDFKFDLRELFPFCIPFDIYRLLSSFDATPQAPHVRLPIVIQSIGFSYTLDLDFSSWDPVAQAMRTAELIVYAIGLAWATGKVIKW